MLEIPTLSISRKLKNIAVLTSGGDAPGMNAAIRSIVRTGIAKNTSVFGIMRGYSGLLEGEFAPMQLSSVANIIQRGGTILKTSRCEAFFEKSARKEAANILKRKKIDALIVIGGDGSFAGANALEKETGFPVIGVPGTIDNDIPGTDDTIGYDTAVNTAIDAIDRIRDTASSHDRLFLVEVMGRNAGYIALYVGVGGGAETIVVPEKKISIDDITRTVDRAVERGKRSSIIVVAEGPRGGQANRIATSLQKRGYAPRVCILGHTQRGGSPTANDRFLASVLGASAVSYLLAGQSDAMVGVSQNKVTLVPFKKIISTKKHFPQDILDLAKVLAT